MYLIICNTYSIQLHNKIVYYSMRFKSTNCYKHSVFYLTKTQVHSLKGISKLLLTTPLSTSLNPSTVSNLVQAFTSRSPLHFLKDSLSLMMQREGITSSDMVFTRSCLSLENTKVVNIDSQGDFINNLQQEVGGIITL